MPAARPRPGLHTGASFALALALTVLAAPARAELGASLSVASEDRFRGRSFSAGQPVATFDLAYDDARGPYAGVSVTGVVSRYNGPQLLLVTQYAGYAWRAPGGATLDLGIINRDYSRFSRVGRNDDLEVYAGIIMRRFSARAYYAPDYYGLGDPAIYAEVEEQAALTRRLRLGLHLGVLAPPRSARYRGLARAQYDWRIGLSRAVHRFTLGATVSGAGPAPDFYDGRPRARARIAVSLSRAF